MMRMVDDALFVTPCKQRAMLYLDKMIRGKVFIPPRSNGSGHIILSFLSVCCQLLPFSLTFEP